MKQGKIKLINWFGMDREEYYALHYQPGDPQWEELVPDEDGNGCVYALEEVA